MLATMQLLVVSCLLGQTPPALPDATPAPVAAAGGMAMPTPAQAETAGAAVPYFVGHGQPGALSVTTPVAPVITASAMMPPAPLMPSSAMLPPSTITPASAMMPPVAQASPPMFAAPPASYLPPPAPIPSQGSAAVTQAACTPGHCPAAGPTSAPQTAGTLDAGRAPLPAPPEPLPPGVTSGPELAPTASPAVSGSGPQSPCLFVENLGPSNISPSKPFVCEVVVRNTGSFAVLNVRIEDRLPAAAQLVSSEPSAEEENHADGGRKLVWNLARLDPGGERRFQVTLRPSPGVTEYVSNATATFSVASTVHCQVAEAKLALTQNGPEHIQVGDRCNFHIRISNAGTGPASHVVLRERLPAGLKHPEGSDIEADFGTIAPGASKTITLQTTAVGGGLQRCSAQVTAEDGVLVKSEPAVTVSEPILFLHNTGPGRRIIDHQANFTLEVLNTGTANAENVMVADVLPEGLDFVSATHGGQFDASSRTVHWQVGTLPAGEQRALELKLLPRTAGDLVNRAVVRADRGLEAKAEASVHAEGIAALMLEVVDLQDPIEVGSETTYEIRVVNQGTATSTAIQIIATVPEGMAVRGASGPVPYRVQGQQVFFESLGKLAAHADCVFRVVVVGLQPGDCRFKVQMSCDQLRTPVYKEESTRVYKE